MNKQTEKVTVYEQDLINLTYRIDLQNTVFNFVLDNLKLIEKTQNYMLIKDLKGYLLRQIKHLNLTAQSEDVDGFKIRLLNKYPQLTPGDIKLATLIRQNLSSKEIADLLNIKTTSVDMRRSRLRQKVDIHHEEKLFNFLFNI